MTDPRRHVRRGDRLAVAAEQINFLNGLMRPGGGFSSGPLPGWEAGRNIVLITNGSGADVPRFGVLEITGIEINPADSEYKENSWAEMPCLTGGMPSTTTGGKFVVTLEPIKAGKVGKAVASGWVQAKVAGIDSTKPFAKPKASRTELEAAAFGHSRILWSSGNWAIIRIGDGSEDRLRLGTISATWTKNNTATVTQQNGDGTAIDGNPTFTARNWFSTITVTSGTKRVACGLVGSTWILLAAEC